MLRYVVTASLISLGALGAPSSYAAPEERSIVELLRAIDVVPPDRASLEKSFPNARAELLAVAGDATQTDWDRLRAISLLSFFPEPATRAALVTLGGDARVEVRRAAIYALGRTFGKVDATVAAVIARVALGDADASTREHAVRALRWVDGEQAATELARIARARPELGKLVDTTRERRVQRLTTGR